MTLYPSPDTRRHLRDLAARARRDAEHMWRTLPPDPDAVRHCHDMVEAMFGRRRDRRW